MKNWVRQHPYLALALGYVLFFVVTAAVWLVVDLDDPVDALFTAFFYTLVYWLLALFQIRNMRKTKQRLDEHGQFRVFIRYPRLSSRFPQRHLEPGHRNSRGRGYPVPACCLRQPGAVRAGN
ncbi:hypothetical protein [Pseudarthrobacter sp. BIM B-2242]|uniref:hypothetical protein n=1 Tax=Pseudarthrobacter sp. BIM B-2242 TaxID=2772401 RepID=UPI00168A99E6|nr:hypothetical protein [Pseudarthrobacter sp. BIM B-2242]QOD04329.1 hypothetical protein IDT60_04505 [Pseudarthrobacter sp. BIM B-2242]